MEDYTAHEKLRVTSGRSDNVLVHYGTDGMKWGRRKYQYEDGSLTPLGRIHYGVGEAKEKSKIKIREAQAKAKATAKVEKAKAKAELEKIKAQAKAYRAKKDADEETERQRIKAEKEAEEARVKAELKAEKAHEREETRRVEAEVNADERMQKAGIEAAANQTKSENSKLTALKVVAGVAAAAGIGYLLYKKLGKSGDANSASKVIEKSEETGKKFIDNVKNKPAAEIIEKGNKAAKETAKKTTDMTDVINKLRNTTKQEASSERVRAAKEKVARDELNKIKEKYFAANERHKNTYTRILKSKAKTAFNTARKQGWNQQWFFGHSEGSMKDMILIHSDSNELYHWGILGMKWGVRRYQNPDGTLTELGKQHYGKGYAKKLSKLDAVDQKRKNFGLTRFGSLKLTENDKGIKAFEKEYNKSESGKKMIESTVDSMVDLIQCKYDAQESYNKKYGADSLKVTQEEDPKAYRESRERMGEEWIAAVKKNSAIMNEHADKYIEAAKEYREKAEEFLNDYLGEKANQKLKGPSFLGETYKEIALQEMVANKKVAHNEQVNKNQKDTLKALSFYDNGKWDVNGKKVATDNLPELYKSLNKSQRESFIEKINGAFSIRNQIKGMNEAYNRIFSIEGAEYLRSHPGTTPQDFGEDSIEDLGRMLLNY